MRKTFSILSLTAILTLTCVGTSLGAANFSSQLPQEQVTTEMIKKSTREVTQIQSNQLEAFAKKQGLVPPTAGATLAAITISIDPVAKQTFQSTAVVPEWCSGLYLSNVYTGGDSIGVEVLRRSYYIGPATPSMVVTQSVAAQWSSNVSIGVDKVTAGVGFAVTSTFQVSDTYPIVVPVGKTATVEARPVYMNKYFEVWDDVCVGSDYKVGAGWASKPIGVSFVTWMN